MLRAALCRGRHLEGQKCGILKFGCFWRFGVCIAQRIRREFALRNYTPQLCVLFVTVHTNVIVVSIRISITDLTGGGAATQTFDPSGKQPRATTVTYKLRCQKFAPEAGSTFCQSAQHTQPLSQCPQPLTQHNLPGTLYLYTFILLTSYQPSIIN